MVKRATVDRELSSKLTLLVNLTKRAESGQPRAEAQSDTAVRKRMAARGASPERQALLAGLEFLRPRALAALAGRDAATAQEFARGLRDERCAFAVADRDDWLFPAFQFRRGVEAKRWLPELVELFFAQRRGEWDLLEFLAMPHLLVGAPPATLLDAPSSRLLWLAEWELEVEA